MANGTMSSDLINSDIVKGCALVDTFIYLRCLTGTLTRAMAIGGESTGWSIQVDPEITVDGKQVHSIEISSKDAQNLEKLKDKRVKATGKLTHKHGVETGDRAVLEVSSIKESKAK